MNDVQRFRFSRPAPKKDFILATASSGDKEKETNTVVNNEFASLWLERTVLVTSHPLPGILRCFPVTSSETYLVSPLRNAIETMEATHTALRDLIVAHKADHSLPLNPLSMKLNGILDPAVMGGIDNYEKAFLNPEYRNSHPEESSDLLRLEGLIAEQIPVLGVGVQLHKARAPPELTPFHQRLEQCFASMRSQVETKYGKRTCDLQIESLTQTVTMRRPQASRGDSHRLSESNIGNSENASIRSHILSSASLQKALGSPSPGTNKKKDSKRRSSRKSDSAASAKIDQPTSQWYTTTEVSQATSTPIITPLLSSYPTTPIFELRQELTPKRPLRSEVEKERRISNRLSGQTQHYLRNINNGMESSGLGKGNRDSIGTTDSNASEDDPPPPLPVKTREADYCNLPEELPVTHCGTGSLNNLNRPLGQWSKSKLPTPTDDLDVQMKPPTPPPKPKRPPYNINKLVLPSGDINNFSQDPSVT